MESTDRSDPLVDLSADLALMVQAARQAGQIALEHRRADRLNVRYKDGNSPVTDADEAVDKFLFETLMGARPTYGWLSEERPDLDPAHRMAAPFTFIADPIDGTRAFIDGRDVWCVSVGLVANGRPVAGVLECPARKQTYTALRGGGAFCNGKPIKVAAPSEPVVVGGPQVWIDELIDQTGLAVERHRHVPSLAYRLAMIAGGAMNGTFVKPQSADWDIAAADLIVHEAGGVMSDAAGAPIVMNALEPTKGLLVAATPQLHPTLLGVVAQRTVG